MTDIWTFRSDRLRELRSALGYSQGEFADYLTELRPGGNDTARRISQQHISKWESGGWEPFIQMLALIAGALGVSADYLLGLVNEPNAHFGENIPLAALERQLLTALRAGRVVEALETVAQILKEQRVDANRQHVNK